ncbi:hypothetical protein [Agrobacterium cavarae]|uniref:hypothetical protein n=1 Tax=Agrobacterium cavarae TaxID=2528239 RepID=UPI003D083673
MRKKNKGNDGGWIAEVKEVVVLGYINTNANLPDYRETFKAWDLLSDIRPVGAWLAGNVQTKAGPAVVHLYRKRIVVVFGQTCGRVDLSQTLTLGLETSEEARKLFDQFKVLIGTDVLEIRSHPVVRSGKLRKKDMFSGGRNTYEYINDGLTSFYTRIYDSDIGEVAIVRISRHITVVYGLGGTLMQDIINLIYDDLLYSEKIEASNVFDLYDSMNKYILPLEINLFVQKLFYGLALFAAFSTAFVTFLTDSIGVINVGGVEPGFDLAKLVSAGGKALVTFCGLICLWIIIRRIIKTGRLGT